ncbi:MAG: iron ABC transporter permease [Gammaproteobacteria bacterium]|nr:iron ABC transporter permease [Gammaproteobacteria bacterium]MCP4089684.1 iron ABC transporter permease [Gammaproteobacteria bacterium]MCP4276032.1 iron ABC transporter permease [Gammaproteobacteria bacterium]MCP4833110.1 iron ABC transporter permease [Gammaproteobacteria bacterium]MCP4929628.1 iron ABC transporter permease [Gammaproteobacteria bacterium]
MNRYLLLSLLSLTALFSLLLALMSGSIQADSAALWQSINNNGDPILRDVVLQLRLPRVLAAFGTGASLALAGAMMQVLLRNPLADPYILGTSGGAAVAALLAMLLGSTGLIIDVAAFGGALVSTLVVFTIAQSGLDRAPGRLLLTGVVIAAGWGAAISLILALAPEHNLRGMLFWLMGDFSFASRAAPSLVLAFITIVIGVIIAPALNLLATGDQQAALLGVAIRPMRALLYFLSSLLTAVAVTTAGTVGFVGLVIPHLIRLIGGSDHRTVLPCSALAGGSLLVLADTLARTIAAPQQLPVGAITAVLGVPLFLVLLHHMGTNKRSGS